MTTPLETSAISSIARTQRSGIDLKGKLALISLIDEQLRSKAARTPLLVDLFNDLRDQIDSTVKSGEIKRSALHAGTNGFHAIEINSDAGVNLGRINMLYLNKPIACYYLVYVEVPPFFRKKGLGSRILSHFREFLNEKGAVGLLNNVIPPNDPTYAIYFKQAWTPIEQIIGDHATAEDENYMIYLPPQLRRKNLNLPVRKLLMHLKRKQTAIEMRDNEHMVKDALSEFKNLRDALSLYFQPEIKKGNSGEFMRFMFTRFATEFARFRREIGELIGYTGGESTEQIELPKNIADLPVTALAPRELAGDEVSFAGERDLCMRLMQALRHHPAQAIESLPDLGRPGLEKWRKSSGKKAGQPISVGDILELGYDPTRLKEIILDGERWVLHRIPARMIPEYKEKQEAMEPLRLVAGSLRAMGAHIKINMPVAIIQDMGNAYVVRRKIDALGWEAATEQIRQDPGLQRLNQEMRLEQLLSATVAAAGKAIVTSSGLEPKTIFEKFSWMVAWDFETNHPKFFMDYAGPVFESIWIT